MYNYEWDIETGGYILGLIVITVGTSPIVKNL